MSSYSVLRTENDLTRWEKTFEKTHIYELDVLKDKVLREKMLTVIDKSKECNTSLLRYSVVYTIS